MKNKINDKNQTQNARHEGSVIVVPSNNGSHLSSDINDNEQKNQEGVLSVNEKIGPVYRIFVSSTQCLMVHYRQIAISAILNATPSQFPISQEYDFTDGNFIMPVDIVNKKIKDADAVILIIGLYYGSLVNQNCANCILQNECKYMSVSSKCKISYTHYEYLLALHYNKKVYVRIHVGISDDHVDDEMFIDCRKKCNEECNRLQKIGLKSTNCMDNCRSKILITKNPTIFYEWVKELKGPLVSEFSSYETLRSEVTKCVELIIADLSKNSCGLIPQATDPASSAFDKDTLSKLKELGIDKCTSKLKGTPFAPLNCMNVIRRRLYFLGVSGAKWVENPENETIFRRMLNRVERNNGKVMFLLINPCSKEFNTMKRQREGSIGINAYAVWKKLLDDYSCLEVRCYNHLPLFRLQFMDDQQLAISRYQFSREQYEKYEHGWDSPHLIINSNAEFTFYSVFESYFMREWQDAINLATLKI
jgi:hypothetical protein